MIRRFGPNSITRAGAIRSRRSRRSDAQALRRWTQIVGKLGLALTPWPNHSWHVPLYRSARGLGTSPIPCGAELIEIGFDFVAPEPTILTSCGGEASIALAPKSVAAFYREL